MTTGVDETVETGMGRARDCIILVTADNHLYMDGESMKVFGYEDPGDVTGVPLSMLFHPEERERVEEVMKRKRGEDTAKRHAFKGIRKDGSPVHVDVSVTRLDYKGERLSLMYLRDVTSRKQSGEEPGRSEERYRALFENSTDAIYLSDRAGRLLDVNASFLELFDYTREEARQLNAREVLSLEDRTRFRAAIRRGGKVKDFDCRLKKKDGTPMDCLITITARRGHGGRVTGFQGIVRDVTAYKAAQEAVHYMAYHDGLTGLPNRMLFRDRLNMAIVNATRNKQGVAVMMLDLDRFKDINDTLGHDMGDRLLRAVATRLVETVRKGDTVARMGGDEFLLIVPDIDAINAAVVVTEKVMESFGAIFAIDDSHTFSVTCSVGIALCPEHGEEAETLVQRADSAMYEVKQQGRNGYRFFAGGSLVSPSGGPDPFASST